MTRFRSRRLLVARDDFLRGGTASPRPTGLPAQDDPAWAVAQARLEAIRPFLREDRSSNAAVAARAEATGHSARSLRRWLAAYRGGGLAGLLPVARAGRPQCKRLHPEVERLLREQVVARGLTRQRRVVEKIHAHVVQACENARLDAPSASTVRRRVREVAPELWVRAREGDQAADVAFRPHGDPIAGATQPLALVQMDHMRLDIEVVEDTPGREPMGRPWITVAIDVFSRVVLGFYLSILDPNAASTGFCLSRALLPKDRWLALLGVQADWPFHGAMRVLHTDNGADFHSKALARACDLMGIEHHFRRPRSPRDGAHIERLLGTFAREVHNLPGTTFRAPHARGDYDSAAQATYTIPELERYVAVYVAKIYHHARHGELGTSPCRAFQAAEPWRPSVPLPDERTMRVSLLPFRRVCTVQEYGIQLFGQRYYDRVLRRWVGVRPDAGFVVCYDPRDMGQVYFHDPELGRYFDIPRRNLRSPAPSLKVVQGVARRVRGKGQRIDPGRLAAALNELDALTDASKALTRRARRARASGHKPPDTAIPPAAAPALPGPARVIDMERAEDEGPLAPFPTEIWAPRR